MFHVCAGPELIDAAPRLGGFLATPQLGEALNQAVAATNAWLGQRRGGTAPDKA